MVSEYLEKYRNEIKNCINDLKHRNTFYQQIPNLVTFARAIGMIPVNILLLTGHLYMGIGLIVVLLITDFFDGKIARKLNIQSKFGADLDAVCDKLMFLGLALPLMINTPILVANFLLEGIISYINVLGRVKGFDTKTVFAGKIKTWFLSVTLFVGYLFQFFGLNSLWFNILASMTIGTQVITVDNYLKEYNNMKLSKIIDDNKDKNNKVLDDNIDTLMKENKFKDSLIHEKEFLLDSMKQDNSLECKKLKREK